MGGSRVGFEDWGLATWPRTAQCGRRCRLRAEALELQSGPRVSSSFIDYSLGLVDIGKTYDLENVHLYMYSVPNFESLVKENLPLSSTKYNV